ncbi:phosphate acyltransferase PlsX [Thalassotalea sp. Y01]|uniref:phosphate acyltransferase PlsX n=1 Tax=Thalassotalea sp. Y01 TaxID=2729613 RepID=UPI00145E6E11|nr:phosphate acyltransferase PlsX [Thalassotalea sp. Y01]NMP15565.1 phosphate acyltransferase PlsX [Thalassotalea sp. Y01]
MDSLTVALDVMGGDNGPLVTIPAAKMALEKMPYLQLTLCGDKSVIEAHLKHHNIVDHSRIEICHTSESIAMNEKPSIALRTKKDSSMRKALDLVQQGDANACVSAGNTGALLAIAHYVLKMLPGVERPALVSHLPITDSHRHAFMLDLGANVFVDSTTLFQFAVMGSVMAQEVDEIESPKVALLNMGEEDIKGSDHIRQTAVLLEQTEDINYVGFIEGNDIFSGKADVIVCDGFVGNIALKTCEGVAKLVMGKVMKIINENKFTRLLGVMLNPTLKNIVKRLNPDQYNGASLIGLRGIVVKSHGNATSSAFYNAIKEAVKEVDRQVPQKINHKLEQTLVKGHK